MKKIFSFTITFFLIFTLFGCAALQEYSLNDFNKPGKLVKSVYGKHGEEIKVKNGRFSAKRNSFVLKYEKLDKEKVNFDYFKTYQKDSTLELNITNFSYPGNFVFKYLVKKTTDENYKLVYSGTLKMPKSNIVLNDEYDHALVMAEVYSLDGKTLFFQTYPEIITFSKEKENNLSVRHLNEAQYNYLKNGFIEKNIPINLLDLNADLIYFSEIPKTDKFEISKLLTKVTYINLSASYFDKKNTAEDYLFISEFTNLKKIVAPKNIDHTELIKLLKSHQSISELVLKNNSKITNLNLLNTLSLDELELNYDDIKPVVSDFNAFKKINLKSLKVDGNFDLSNVDFGNKLTKLKLSKVTLTSLNNISKLTNLSDLKLYKIKGIKNDNFALLGNLTKLKYLEITYSATLSNVSFLNKLTHLSELNLSNSTNFSTFNFQNNLSKTSIKKLNLASTKFSSLSEYTYFNRTLLFYLNNTPFLVKYPEISDAKEITYFDGKNYIIDHIDHIHAEQFSDLSLDEQSKFFKKTKETFFGKGKVIGFDKKGYFVKVRTLNQANQIIEQIYYFLGFPDFEFDFPDWRVDEFEPSAEIKESVLNRLVQKKLSKQPELKTQIDKITKNTNLTIFEKVSQINLL